MTTASTSVALKASFRSVLALPTAANIAVLGRGTLLSRGLRTVTSRLRGTLLSRGLRTVTSRLLAADEALVRRHGRRLVGTGKSCTGRVCR